MTKVSVVIPSNHSHYELLKIVSAICGQSVKPTEVVIVDSAGSGGLCPLEIKAICRESGIELIYKYLQSALPGHARNVGLTLARTEFIAFADVQTIPRPHWLEESLTLLDSRRVIGVWGATYFKAETKFESLVRDGFYGVLPRKTLPGSVFSRDVFKSAGQFIDWVRAGEDTEWMLRVELLKLPIVRFGSVTIDYIGLVGLDTKQFLNKWRRNYTASRNLPHFFPQRLFLWLFLYPLVMLVAFNWNYLVADWHKDSPFYIGHITKMVAILPSLAYIFVRGALLPWQRGVRLRKLLPARFMAIALICLLADCVKMLVFSIPRPINNER